MKAIGGDGVVTASTRTSPQTYIAKWWQSNPVASWNDVARQLIVRNDLSVSDAAELLAMENLAAVGLNIRKALERLQKSIPGILDYCDGINSSPEGLEQGFTHGFIMTFKDAAARDAYLPHPEHERVKAGILPHVESAIIFDFEV